VHSVAVLTCLREARVRGCSAVVDGFMKFPNFRGDGLLCISGTDIHAGYSSSAE
jgi:hypothetical protein